MAIKSFNEMRKIDISKYTDKRDGAEYLNWANCIALLHEAGAKDVYFVPIPAEDGSSLHKSSSEFKNKDKTNQIYETKIEIHIDDLCWTMTSPVMNGVNPVQNNSMNQLRVWNSMCRSFVKGVAIRTGLGFDLWMKSEAIEAEVEDVNRHDIRKVQEKVLEMITALNKQGLTIVDIANELDMTEDTLRSYFAQYSSLYTFEKNISELLNKRS